MLDEQNSIEDFAAKWFQSESSESAEGKEILRLVSQQLVSTNTIDEQRLLSDLLRLAVSLENTNAS